MFCSHTLIGAFSTSMRELSRGHGRHNEYPVSVAECCIHQFTISS